MAFRWSSQNLLKTWTAHAAATLEAGFSVSALTDDRLTLAARTTSGATQSWVYDRGVGAGSASYVFAGFGTRSKDLGVANVNNVFIRDSPDGSTKTTLGGWVPDTRGDGRAALTTTQRYLHFDIVQAVADELDVVELWAGPYSDLSRGPIAPLSWEPSYASIVNDAEDRTIWTSQQAERAHELVLRWGALATAHAQEVEAIFDAARGRARPILIWPDTGSSKALLGHLTEDRLPWAYDTPVVRNVELGFQEQGRYLYA